MASHENNFTKNIHPNSLILVNKKSSLTDQLKMHSYFICLNFNKTKYTIKTI